METESESKSLSSNDEELEYCAVPNPNDEYPIGTVEDVSGVEGVELQSYGEVEGLEYVVKE